MFRAISLSSGRATIAATAAMFLAGTAIAAETERVNVSSTGVQSSVQAFPTAFVTPDGRFAVFASQANNIVPGDTNSNSEVFVRDRLLGTTARVSLPDPSTGNAQGNGASLLAHNGARVISDNGRYVVFQSDADNLVAGDTNQVTDVFVRDRDADNNGVFDEPGAGMTKTVRVSLTSNESQSFGACPNMTCTHGAFGGAISANGRYVVFWSEFNFAGSEAFTNIFRRDRDADNDGIFDEAGGSPDAAVTQLVSTTVSCVGCEQDGFSDLPVISANGRHVAFRSASSHLVFSDNNQAIDIFVRDMNQTNCVRMSVRTDGGEGEPNTDSNFPSISDDGRYVAFQSANDDLVPEDNGNLVDIFVRDRNTDNDSFFDEPGASAVERVSLGFSSFPLPGGVVPLNNHSSAPCISGDGRYVAFQSDANNNNCGLLSCDDSNTFTDVFVHDRNLQRTYLASVNYNDAQGNGNSTAATISKDGRFVGFRSVATNLGFSDSNGAASDVYVRGFIGESNSTCSGIETITPGSHFGDTYGSGKEGSTTCGMPSHIAPDVWFKFTAGCTGQVNIDTLGSNFDTMLSVHSACPGTTSNELACNDDENIGAGITTSKITMFVQQGQMYVIRLSGFSTASGYYQLNLGACSPCCPGNADKITPGSVNFADVTAVLASFGMNYAISGPGDADCDGQVNFADITNVLANFNMPCN
ncbi:MAG: hypothetical protein JNK58_08460 [Phycisphaerae bacterium]|nr:hypothetical protein [Phycisphaerae bacterium]